MAIHESCPLGLPAERHAPIEGKYLGFIVTRGPLGEYVCQYDGKMCHVCYCPAECRDWIDACIAYWDSP